LRELEVFVKRFLVFRDENAALEELRSCPVATNSRHSTTGGNGHGKNGVAGAEEKASSLKSLVRSAKGEAEKNAITQALEETHWNRKAAARLLSVSYRALLYKIQEYQIVPSGDSGLSYSYSIRQAKIS
jgi:DNA-binding NtrC family response regulator